VNFEADEGIRTLDLRHGKLELTPRDAKISAISVANLGLDNHD
jgi:hypothetical protein